MHDGAPPAFLGHLLGIIDRTAQKPAHVPIWVDIVASRQLHGRRRYALSLLIHHSTLVILLWDGAAYNTAADRIDLCAPGPSSSSSGVLILLPSEARLACAGTVSPTTTLRTAAHSRSSGSTATLSTTTATCHTRADFPTLLRQDLTCSGSNLCSFSRLVWRASQLLLCFSSCSARPCAGSKPPAYPATTPVLIAIDCEAHNQSSAG